MRFAPGYYMLAACLGLCLITTRCQKSVPATDVISIRATSASVLADGSSQDTIYADLPISTLDANLGVTFGASSGLYANGFDTMSVFASRTDIDPGKITAVVIWHASLRSGPDTLSASTETIPQYTGYVTINLNPSTVDSIYLTPSVYTTNDSFGSQVILSGILYNSQLGMVSQQTMVQFSDLTAAGVAAGGRFVPGVAIADSSKISSIYFPPQLPEADSPGIYITIKASVLNAGGSPSGARGSTKIYVTYQ